MNGAGSVLHHQETEGSLLVSGQGTRENLDAGSGLGEFLVSHLVPHIHEQVAVTFPKARPLQVVQKALTLPFDGGTTRTIASERPQCRSLASKRFKGLHPYQVSMPGKNPLPRS